MYSSLIINNNNSNNFVIINMFTISFYLLLFHYSYSNKYIHTIFYSMGQKIKANYRLPIHTCMHTHIYIFKDLILFYQSINYIIVLVSFKIYEILPSQFKFVSLHFVSLIILISFNILVIFEHIFFYLSFGFLQLLNN